MVCRLSRQQPIFELNSEVINGGFPVPDRQGPFFTDGLQRQIKNLLTGASAANEARTECPMHRGT